MVVIRLARGGNKKNPFYHIMVADCRYPRDGRFIECVGYYNPMARGYDTLLRIEKERIFHWFNQGAKATLRVQHLLKKLEKSPEWIKKGNPRRRYKKSGLKHLQTDQPIKAQTEQAKENEEVSSGDEKSEEIHIK